MKSSKSLRLKAFTILEMTVAMLIAAIVIGITYTAYSIVSKSYLNFKSRNEDMAVFARLDQLLRRDFERSESINSSGNKIQMYGLNSHIINYELASGYIIRNAQNIDTFRVRSDHYQLFFQGKPQNNSEETDIKNDESNRIDEFSFVVTFRGDTSSYSYYKKYSSVNLINRNPNAIN